MKRYLLLSILAGQLFINGCGEDSTESVILGSWLATNIVREDCTEPLDNGAFNCVYDLEQCKSCMTFILARNGTYTLTADFNTGIAGETGDYETKSSVIRLQPTDGEAYDLPISDVSATNMVIDLSLSNGCTAIITLTNTDC